METRKKLLGAQRPWAPLKTGVAANTAYWPQVLGVTKSTNITTPATSLSLLSLSLLSLSLLSLFHSLPQSQSIILLVSSGILTMEFGYSLIEARLQGLRRENFQG
jgi:hypothetical protein